MMLRSPRLVIVDQSLRDMAGHHYEYDLALVRAATKLGIRTTVGAHISVVHLPALGDAVRPWFERAWYHAHNDPPPAAAQAPSLSLPSKSSPRERVAAVARRVLGRHASVLGRLERSVGARAASAARRAIGQRPPEPSGFAAEVFSLIRAEGLKRRDHALVHTFSIPELDSLIELARNQRGLPRIHFVLRRDAEEPTVKTGPKGGIAGSFARVRESRRALNTLRFYADTEDLARQYGALSGGIEIGVLPIPHCLPFVAGRERAGGPEPLRLVYLGDAREEKGFQLLPDVVDALTGTLFPRQRARFVIQANVSVAGDSAALVAARARLAAYPRSNVELILDQLDIEGFHDLVRSADVVLLPYDRDAYQRRSSGILVQALAAGRAVVVPAGTWMERQGGADAAFVFTDSADLARAVATAAERWPALAAGASERASRWHALHNADRYIAQILRVRQ